MVTIQRTGINRFTWNGSEQFKGCMPTLVISGTWEVLEWSELEHSISVTDTNARGGARNEDQYDNNIILDKCIKYHIQNNIGL